MLPDSQPVFGASAKSVIQQDYTMNRSTIGLIGAAVLTAIGIVFRLKAHAMAWPLHYSYSGPASETSWGRQEAAIGQIGIALMSVGILLLVITYIHWLFAKEPGK